jgi:predicted dehydrogenase
MTTGSDRKGKDRVRTYKVAFVGSGARSNAYASAYAKKGDIEIAALADPNAEHRGLMVRRNALPAGLGLYDDWRDMLREHEDLDGVVIATPNYLHAEPAIACYERGLPIALEKPLEVTKERCDLILDAERANSGRTLIGFVLRSTPFYRKVRELLDNGSVGRICSVQADELVGWTVTSIMNRSPWRRFQALSGGAMLEKSCHDMDLLNWIVGERPMALCSFGSRMILAPNPALPGTCDKCPLAADCPYYKKAVLASQEDAGEAVLHEFIREDNRCIYNVEKDIVDVQNVAVQYEGGCVANFVMNFHTAGTRAGRNIHVVGHKGRMWGSMHEGTVYQHENISGSETTHPTTTDGTGHGGGDRIHALELHRMMADPSYTPAQNSTAAYLSAVMCFAADISRVDRREVSFRYRPGGRIDIV